MVRNGSFELLTDGSFIADVRTVGASILLALFHQQIHLPEETLCGFARNIDLYLREAGHFGLQNHLVRAR